MTLVNKIRRKDQSILASVMQSSIVAEVELYEAMYTTEITQNL